jgi:hypothetical protein
MAQVEAYLPSNVKPWVQYHKKQKTKNNSKKGQS